ncbi:MAG: hypothetical protein JKY48_11455 [Flavobacteriales bacterium]|nr:hypothetical protein [Flavobacteriales bacterium]
MKQIKIIFTLFILATTGACEHKAEHHALDEHKEFKKEIENLKVKLDATEAQLLNVRSEIANIRSNDSLSTTKATD